MAGLQGRLQEVAAAWGLTLGREVYSEPRACCFEATAADGRDGTLKLVSPRGRAADEVSALRAWDGRGAPEVLRADPDRGALLLERIRPGDPAADARAEDVAALLSLLQVTPPTSLPRLETIAGERLERAVTESRVRGTRVAWARTALARLLDGAQALSLVHGNLGPGSVVRCNRRGLCAIDPIPCAGDPAYDAATWVHAGGRPGRRARFDELSRATDIDAERLRDWCGVVAVLG